MPNEWRHLMNDWLASHSGVITAEQLRAWDCPRRQVTRLVERSELESIFTGVYRSTHWPLGKEQRLLAACLVNPNVNVACTNAAEYWDFRRLPRDVGLHALVPHGCSPTLPGITIHRCRRIDPMDVVVCSNGLRVTSPPRTLFDCADMLGVEAAASVLEQLINDGRGSFVTHAATLARLGHHRRPGTRTMVQVINSRPAWRRALQSDLESRVLAEIARQGLPSPETQFRVRLPGGRRIRLDFAWPEFREALEVDHPFWHAGATEAHRDKHRDRKMATIGWHTSRITELDVNAGLTESIADLGIILHIARLAA